MWSFVQTVRCSKPHPEGEYSEDPLDGNTVLVFPNIYSYLAHMFALTFTLLGNSVQAVIAGPLPLL